MYSRVRLNTVELALLLERDGRLVAQADSVGATAFTRRGLMRPLSRHVLSVEGPQSIDREDLPYTRRALVADRRLLYVVLVQNGDKEGIAAALTFADVLASRTDGVVIDAQKEPSAVLAKVDGGAVAETWMHFCWFRLKDDKGEFARDYLRGARAHFPLAVPTRFGTSEPLQGRLPRDTDTAFTDLYASECAVSSLIFDSGRKASGYISGWSRDVKMRYHSARVAIRLDAVVSAGLVTAAEEFLVTVAGHSNSFFAFSEVNQSRSVTAEFAHFDGGWSGLPTAPQWMTWFGAEYAPLVRPYLLDGVVREHETGVSHRWADTPLHESEIVAAAESRYWLDRRLTPAVDGDRVLEPAVTVPSTLRAPAPGSTEALRLEAVFAEKRSKSRTVRPPQR